MYVWKDFDWAKAERDVFKLQCRIYKASLEGDAKKVHDLQRLVLSNLQAKFIAVRRVTQDNRGKKTAGVDGIKSLTESERTELVFNLKLDGKADPTRRVLIPKPGTDEKRPLGIPTMRDRALQTLVKLALEPEWEAKFEPNSYGFRPGRSAHDAIQAIFGAIRYKPKYVLDADIAKCFDRINHDKLLDKLNTFPTLRKQIKAWLKCGVMDGDRLFPTIEGTPQGGTISPLLANIALHGMEELVKEYAANQKWFTENGSHLPVKRRMESLSLIRYADDFVVLHEKPEVIEECKQLIEQWLSDYDLELKPSKTRIAHTLHEGKDGTNGFNFLGFYVAHYPMGKHNSGFNTYGQAKGYKTIIKPSEEKVKLHLKVLGDEIKKRKAVKQEALIGRLNSIIRGWSNYYRTVVSKEIFDHCDHVTYQMLRSWAFHRHPKKNRQWVVKKYWQTTNGNRWVFATNDGVRLYEHGQTKITRHVKVKGDRSPYDGDSIYWSTRLGRNPEMPKQKAELLKRQKGICKYCGLYFKEGDILEIDHIIPRSKGGKMVKSNIQLLHRHCHDQKTRSDNKSKVPMTRAI
jgi:RNA-directed DNA polymerase